MDSSLLNMVYDDPFDGNYVKYDKDTEFWTSENETMGMQLTETLHGILPIVPTEDFHKDDNTAATINVQNNRSVFNYEDFAGQHLATGGAIEIVTVDPNADGYDTDSEDDSEDNVDDEKDVLDFERQSQYSNATFRSRTDSSSIGDYESHTSDYEDDDDIDKIMIGNTTLTQNEISNVSNDINNSIIDLHSNLSAPDGLLLDTSYHKVRTYSTNTISSDVDGFGLQIDANNFDLADFITKDDFQLQIPVATFNNSLVDGKADNTVIKNIKDAPSVVHVMSNKHDDSDCDSVIVDVETIEMSEDEASSLRKASEIMKPSCTEAVHVNAEEDLAYVDNVKSDPSWSPTPLGKKLDNHKVEEKPSAPKPNFARNFPLVPNKKQCDLLKGKFSKNKGKLIQKPAKLANGKAEGCISLKNASEKTTASIKAVHPVKKVGIGMGGKNLSLISQKCSRSTSEQSSEDNITPIKSEINPNSPQQQKPANIHNEDTTPAQKAQSVKRKLNLEEYKKRRDGVPPVTTANSEKIPPKFEIYKIPKVENKLVKSSTSNDKTPTVNSNTITKHSEAVTSIVKSLKEQPNPSQKIDPITEAKNKVLRMQELKRAQQMRIIDSTISAKVPRVTKLLPLKEIVKDTPYLNEEVNKSIGTQSSKSDYEEIIIISVGCNTNISIPPILDQAITPVNNVSRSLLKSSVLLSTISNTFQKVKANDNTKISKNSLISSIQDVVVNKSVPVDELDSGDTANVSKPEHNGENKIIMHLRKDRIRKRMCTIGTQTDIQPEFPSLALPKSGVRHTSRERTQKHRKKRCRKHNLQSSSSFSEYSSDDQSDNSNSSSISRSRENSCSSSLDRIRTYDSAIGTGGYSSRSSRRHRSSISSSYSESADRNGRGRRQRRTSYTKRSSRKRSRTPYSSSSYTSDSDRSRSPNYGRSRSRSNSRKRSRSKRSSYRPNNNKYFLDRNISQPAVEERRIVYVGRIEQETTKDMLRRKFIQYGTIKQISIHYKDTGMKYGFVTFERSQDAFNAIDSSTRDPQINMYDVSFGGRRAFCRASYADLDNAGINTYQSYVFPQPAQHTKDEDSFEALLMKMKAKLNANKTNTTTQASAAAATANTTAPTTATNCRSVITNNSNTI